MFFQDDFTAKLPVYRPVSDAEAALTQDSLDLVIPQFGIYRKIIIGREERRFHGRKGMVLPVRIEEAKQPFDFSKARKDFLR